MEPSDVRVGMLCVWPLCSGVCRQMFTDGIHCPLSDGGEHSMWSQLVVVSKPLTKVSVIGKEFPILEGVPRCYLNHTVLDLA